MKDSRFNSALLISTLASSIALCSSQVWAADDHPPKSINLADMAAKAEARFADMDANSDGVVSLTEFEAAEPPRRDHRRHGPHAGDRPQRNMDNDGRPGHGMAREWRHRNHGELRGAAEAELFDILDSDSNGQLSRAEFTAANKPENRRLARKRAMFKHLDQDGDGELTADEMPNPAERLSAADTDGDGIISRKEMRAYRKSKQQDATG